MKVRLNGEDYGECSTREEFLRLFDELRKGELRRGKVVMRADVDGKEVMMDGIAEVEPSSVSEMNVVSTDARSMISGALEQSLDYIPVLKEHLPSISIGLRSGEIKDVMDALSKAIEGIMWLNRIVSYSLRILGAIEPTTVDAALGEDIREFTQKEVKLKDVFDDVSEALEGGDFLRVADAIDYEILPWLDSYESVIKEMDSYINRDRN